MIVQYDTIQYHPRDQKYKSWLLILNADADTDTDADADAPAGADADVDAETDCWYIYLHNFLNIKMDWYNMYTLLNMKMNTHFLSPSQGRCCSLLYDCLFLHLRLAVPQN